MPQGPGPLKQRKADVKYAKSIGQTGDLGFDGFKKLRIEWVGKTVVAERRFGKDAAFDIADVRVSRSVPDHAEIVFDAMVANLGVEADRTSQTENVVG